MVQHTKCFKGVLLSTGTILFGVSMMARASVCTAVIDDNDTVANYSNFAPLRERNAFMPFNDEAQATIKDFYSKYYSSPKDADSARKLIGGLYNKPNWLDSSCPAKVEEHLKSNPDVYIYVGGYGQHVQLNEQFVDAAEVVKWVNRRDPNALVLSLGWSCDSAVFAGHDWCRKKAPEYDVLPNHKIDKDLISVTAASPNKALLGQINESSGKINGLRYNESLTHSLEMAAFLVNHLLVAGVNKIYFVGYSLGAQVTTEIMSFDYNPQNDPLHNKEGFPWSVRGACSDGSNICRISELSKVQWALAMGTPGWTPALRNAHNGYNEVTGKRTRRTAEDMEQNRNGGLLRIKDTTFDQLTSSGESTPRELKYKDKLVVYNKRNDPTSDANDLRERGIGSAFLAEYNHYGHDYIRPLFWNKTWLSTIEKFLENKEGKSSQEWGAIWESGANFDFEDCTNSSCNPASVFAMHQDWSSHQALVPMRPKNPVRVVSDSGTKAVALENSSDNVLEAFAMDQEDLQGSVEFSWKPEFDLVEGGIHGLFSYESCEGSEKNLMPQAYVQNGELIFEMKYNGKNYSARVDSNTLSQKIKTKEWAHLSFGWSLPTVSLADEYKALPNGTPNGDAPTKKALAAPFQDGMYLSAALQDAPRTTLRRQQSSETNLGKLSIWINGTKAMEDAPLGEPDSKRECLLSAEVNSEQTFDLFDKSLFTGSIFGAYKPYQGYRDNMILPNGASLGTICKGYKIRNSPVKFGCAKSTGVNASSLMDNVRIIFGPQRTKFPEINPSGGLPKEWTEVLGI